MPHVPSMPPNNRFFARLDRFECECPSCGELLFTMHDARRHPGWRHTNHRRRALAAEKPRSPSIRDMVFNPVTQRLRCPFCRSTYAVGIVAYPIHPGGYLREEPSDTRPTKRQRMEMRRAAGGFFIDKDNRSSDEVNLAIDGDCSCPEKGWVPSCRVHGYGGPLEHTTGLP